MWRAGLAADAVVLDQPFYEEELFVFGRDIRIASCGYLVLDAGEGCKLSRSESVQQGVFARNCLGVGGICGLGCLGLEFAVLILYGLGHCFVLSLLLLRRDSLIWEFRLRIVVVKSKGLGDGRGEQGVLSI